MRRFLRPFLITFALSATLHADEVTTKPAFEPNLPTGTVALNSDALLSIPPDVAEAAKKDGAVPFVVAKAAPSVDVAFHGSLRTGVKRTWWSNWGDICVASDGLVYCAIGDHGDDAGGDAFAFVYRYDPSSKKLEQIIDVNSLIERKHGEPAFSKIHAKIDEGKDGRIYFTATINNGGKADDPKFKWSDTIPGGQLYAYDPRTGKTEIVTHLPRTYVSTASLMDRERNTWWCNLDRDEKNALWAFDLATGKELIRFPEAAVSLNRNFALARDGSIYFNGPDAMIWKYNRATNQISATKSKFPDKGMRCSTHETKGGHIYGVSMGQQQLFRYSTKDDKLDLLGPDFLTGFYNTVCVMSPDEKFVYYIPGGPGTPVIQYDVAKNERKVIAFLAGASKDQIGYYPAHPFGLKISADGATLYMNTHGTAIDPSQPQLPEPKGVSRTSFYAIHIPQSER